MPISHKKNNDNLNGNYNVVIANIYKVHIVKQKFGNSYTTKL